MGKYNYQNNRTTEENIAMSNILIANELAEANRLKRLTQSRYYKAELENPYSEDDDKKIAKEMLKELEDQA